MMSETPDFNQIARRVADKTGVDRLEEWDSGDPTRVVDAIAEQLRQVWNARGAADIAKLEAVYTGPFAKLQDRQLLDRALRTLDR